MSPIRALFLVPVAGVFFTLGAALDLLSPFLLVVFFSLFASPLSALSSSSSFPALSFSSISLSEDWSFFNSSSFVAWLFALGAPLTGSFFDPASFSYSPPASSYFLESLVAYVMADQLTLDNRCSSKDRRIDNVHTNKRMRPLPSKHSIAPSLNRPYSFHSLHLHETHQFGRMTSSSLRWRAFLDLLAQLRIGRFPFRRWHFEQRQVFLDDSRGTEVAIQY